MRISDWSSDVCSSDLVGDAIRLDLLCRAGDAADDDRRVADRRRLPDRDGKDAAPRPDRAGGGLGISHAKARRIHQPPFALSLSKGPSFLQGGKEERCFDKLSTNGF